MERIISAPTLLNLRWIAAGSVPSLWSTVPIDVAVRVGCHAIDSWVLYETDARRFLLEFVETCGNTGRQVYRAIHYTRRPLVEEVREAFENLLYRGDFPYCLLLRDVDELDRPPFSDAIRRTAAEENLGRAANNVLAQSMLRARAAELGRPATPTAQSPRWPAFYR